MPWTVATFFATDGESTTWKTFNNSYSINICPQFDLEGRTLQCQKARTGALWWPPLTCSLQCWANSLSLQIKMSPLHRQIPLAYSCVCACTCALVVVSESGGGCHTSKRFIKVPLLGESTISPRKALEGIISPPPCIYRHVLDEGEGFFDQIGFPPLYSTSYMFS